MADLISREAALDKLDVTMRITAPDDYRLRIPEAIENLPAVDAIPVEWLEQQFYDNPKSQWAEKCRDVYTKWQKFQRWQKEQEAR